MENSYQVRYGHTYKVALAIILPSLLIGPFILGLTYVKPLEEWVLGLSITLFLAMILYSSYWIVMQVYPIAIIGITTNEIRLTFKTKSFLAPSDFSFYLDDLVSFKNAEMKGVEYYKFSIRNPTRNFQISSASNDVADFLSFYEAMSSINEKVNPSEDEQCKG